MCMGGSRVCSRLGARTDAKLEGLTLLLLLRVAGASLPPIVGTWAKVSAVRLDDLHSVSGPAGESAFCHVRSSHFICGLV